jgi:D-alanyl-D-alanine carboxypeptidase (penicillin-binding protein 5/6)
LYSEIWIEPGMFFRYFLPAFLFSIAFWWMANIFQKNLEGFFFWEFTKDDFEAFSAAVSAPVLPNLVPLRIQTKPELSPEEISAKAALIMSVENDGKGKILFQKNSDRSLPIASLAKLMTAYVAVKSYDLADSITVSKKAVEQEEKFGELKIGEKVRVADLLWMLLIESSNDAAWALAEKMGVQTFVEKMNAEARKIGMSNTFFSNPTGLDPDSPEELITRASAKDLALLASQLLRQEPFLWKILRTQETDLYVREGDLHHTLRNTTNGFASTIPRLVGAKTGFTPLAKQCLLLVQENPRGNGSLIYVLLGSDDRFGEMQRLVEWANTAWKW